MAQGGPTATLHHGGEFKTFYSSSAFKQALAEAQPGDIINLSAGTFEGTQIKVPVTVRGAGIGALDNVENNSKAHTSISGSLPIKVLDNEDGHTLSLEGLICEDALNIWGAKNVVFSKMRIRGAFGYTGSASLSDTEMTNLTFLHCIFDNIIELSSKASISIYNSVISNGFNFSNGNVITVYNSLLLPISISQGSLYHTGLTMINCIIDVTAKSTTLQSCKCYNCVVLGGNDKTIMYDNKLSDRNNILFPSDTSAFLDGTYYRLTDEAAAYLGDDDTQVGIYGSSLPFSVKTSYPQIKKFYVAPESTADGKLKIEIEIDAAD